MNSGRDLCFYGGPVFLLGIIEVGDEFVKAHRKFVKGDQKLFKVSGIIEDSYEIVKGHLKSVKDAAKIVKPH